MGKNKIAAGDTVRVMIDDEYSDDDVVGNQKGMLPVNDHDAADEQQVLSTKENNTTIETCKSKNNSTGRTPPQEEMVQPQATVAAAADDEEEVGDDKKKKKNKNKKKMKKEKEKENNEVESKPDHKKHVEKIQKNLARIKEAEEKEKREEEVRLRKEEDERLRQQELERIARSKREKEKEKMLKKKQQGKLLTAKQKAEAQRLELKRKQFVEKGGGGVVLRTILETPTKRPVYITKKSNKQASTSNQEENHVFDEADMENVEEDSSYGDDEWDAKRWDDAHLKFADEDEHTSQLVKKEIKSRYETHDQPVAAANKGKQEEAVSVEEGDQKTLLRSPICCIMGHVDAGKTKLLDCITRTNVQEGEAGGITQQIRATYIPADNIRERTKDLKADAKLDVPGLVLIDTPGHEAFNNLRSRGSGLCDIAILVVDIMHGLEPQTIESIKLLRMRNIEFIVALNKVDRLYGWKTCCNTPIGKALKQQQSKDVQGEFNHRVTQIITEFKEQGLNTELYYKNKDRGRETYSIVPTSATSGEGIPEMLLLLIQWAQKTMVKQLTYTTEIQCKVLEVKVIEGRGTTIDVVLVNGVLHEGDEIVVCGFQGPIHTTIRSLLTPHPTTRGAYIHHKEIKAAQGIKITAQNLEHAVAGTALYVIGPNDEMEEIKKLVMDGIDRSVEGPPDDDDVEEIKESVLMSRNIDNRSGEVGGGVYIQASTRGSLEALLAFLKTTEVSIPVSGIGLGPVHKKDVMKASVMLEKKKKEFATILAFDVKVTHEAQVVANEVGVKIFINDIMYHLCVQFKAYLDNLKEVKKKEAAEDSIFPCVLKIMPNCVFNKKDPIILGVDVKHGILKIGTPICIPQKDFIDIGRISSIENNGKPLDYVKKGHQVSIKITGTNAEEQQKMFGRHFDMNDELVSHITRNSVNVLKANYRDELSKEEWKLVRQLTRLFNIQ